MAAIDFPAPPLTVGQVHLGYTWDGEKWVVTPEPGGGVIEGDAPADGFTYGRKINAWEKAVPLSGGDMTGNLKIDKAGPVFILDKATSNEVCDLAGQVNGNTRWVVRLGSNSTENPGTDIGSDFEIHRFLDNSNSFRPVSISRKLGTVSIAAPLSAPSLGSSGATVMQVYDGAPGTPHIPNTPSVSISRYDALHSDTFSGNAPALWVETVAAGTGAGNPNSCAIVGTITQSGKGDPVGVVGSATLNGPGPNTAYGGYFSAFTSVVGNLCFAIESDTGNQTGADAPYTNLSPYPRFVGIHCAAYGANLSTVGVWLSANGAMFDVGVALTSGSVKTTGLQDDSSSINVIKATGTHTNGVDLSAATFSGSPFKSTGFSISPTGIVNTAELNAAAVSSTGAFGPWTAYTPTVEAGTGTLTAASATGSYRQVGKLVFFRTKTTITTNGTGATSIRVGIPVAALGDTSFNGVTAPPLKALIGLATATDNRITMVNYDGTYPGGDGAVLCVSGSYEAV